MFKQTSYYDWSNAQTAGIASLYDEDFKSLLTNKKNTFKSVRDVSESFREHVIYQTTKANDYAIESMLDIEDVNWAEIATTFVLHNPIWSSIYN